jgi:hypothetical protein
MQGIELERYIPGFWSLQIIRVRRRDSERIVSIRAQVDIVRHSNTLLQNEIVLLRVHGCDGILRDISFFSTLTLNNNCVIAFIIIKVLACNLIMINNDT